jgi:hypothetical protein
VRRAGAAPLAVIALVLAVLAAVAILAGPAGGDDQDPSSTANGRAGTLALYEWLQALGHPVHRIDSSWDLSGTDVLISAEPLAVNPYSAADARTLTAFLRGGGEVILAVTDPATVAAVLDPLQIASQPTGAASVAPSQPFPGSAGVTSVPLAAPGGAGPVWAFSGGPGLVPLLGPGAAPEAAEVMVGSGRLVLLGSEQPLSNDGLRRGDSAALVLALLETAKGPSIGFDEVHHAPPVGADDYGLSAVVQGPLLLAALLAVIVVLAWLATSGRRLGRPQPRRDPTRVPSVSEHLDAVAHLLSRARDRGAVANRYAEELKLRVGRAAGVDPRLGDADFAARLAGFGQEPAGQAAALLAEARRLAASRPSEPDLLDLARRVDELEAAWGAVAVR